MRKYWKIALAAAFLAVAGLVFGLSERKTGEVLSEDGTVVMEDAVLVKDGMSGNVVPPGNAGISGNTVPSENGGKSGNAVSPEKAGKPGDVVPPEAGTPEENGTEEAAGAPALYVYVCGEVVSPGVYALSEDSRIYEAVEAAGGFTEEAAREAVNLAARVSDGMQITVYSMEEAMTMPQNAKAGEPDSGPGLVNLNTATKEELMTLKGIGESKAEDILRYRETSGGFKRIEDIMKVPGIKDAGFQKIKDSITV